MLFFSLSLSLSLSFSLSLSLSLSLSEESIIVSFFRKNKKFKNCLFIIFLKKTF